MPAFVFGQCHLAFTAGAKKTRVTDQIMVHLLMTLKDFQAPELHNRKMLWSAETMRAHLTSAVFEATVSLGIFPMVFLDRITWTMQFWDTRVFAVFQRCLTRTVNTAYATRINGKYKERSNNKIKRAEQW